VDSDHDRFNCGACGVSCPGGERCVFGACQLVCAPGQFACNDQCVTTSNDHLHCGGCNNPCDGGVCVNSQCASACPAPLEQCPGGGACIDPRFDPDHCGGCGNSCPPVENAARACGFFGCTRGACAPGFGDCNAELADGCETNLAADPANCGSCGVVCAGACDGGFCEP
jgi:hypothetical protein